MNPNQSVPSAEEPVFLVVGKLHRSHGVHGEMVLEILTDFPERLKPGIKVYLGESHEPVHIHSLRPAGKSLLVSFREYDQPEKTAIWRNQLMYVRADDRPLLPEGEYYHHQILGLSVYEGGQLLGQITQILETGANDVYVVAMPSGKELLLPAIDPVIIAIDLQQGTMEVRLLPGLMPE